MKNYELNVKVVAEKRREKRLTKTALAVAVGVTENMIQQLESGRKQPSEKLFMRLSEVLDEPFRKLAKKVG